MLRIVTPCVSAIAPGFASELLEEKQVVICTHWIAASSIRRSARPSGVAMWHNADQARSLTRGVILVDGGMDLCQCCSALERIPPNNGEWRVQEWSRDRERLTKLCTGGA